MASTRSPITNLSKAVLREIFLHCLPRYPLEERQPKATIAPLLLCHVCSSWRTVALASTALWSHLPYSLTVYQDAEDEDEFSLVAKEIEFVRWWKKNQGATAPFLRLRADIKKKRPENVEGLDEDGEGVKFLVEWIASAQYLDLDTFFWAQIQEKRENEVEHELEFPNLRTLIKPKPDEDKYGSDDDDPFFEDLIPDNTTSPLHRLAIHQDALTIDEVPNHWATLTHITLRDTTFSPDFWFSLTRAVPNLEWGHFDFRDMENFEDYDAQPTKCTLSRLTTLYVAFRDKEECAAEFSFPLLFRDLSLPAVRTLSLGWFLSDYWYHQDAVETLYSILENTPAVTMLALAEHFLALADPSDGSRARASTKRPKAKVYEKPLWRVVPHLTDLHFEVPQEGTRDRTRGDVEDQMDAFVEDTLFSSGSWLDLGNPACPIRSVVIVDNGPEVRFTSESDDESDDGSSDVKDGIGEFTMSCIQKHVGDLPHVAFKLASKSVDRIAAEVWREWGSTSST